MRRCNIINGGDGMDIALKRTVTEVKIARLAEAALQPKGQAKLSQLIRIAGVTGRRDPLSEFQQKILTAAIFRVHPALTAAQPQAAYTMKTGEFLQLCDCGGEDVFAYLAHELEKLSRKGLWLHDAAKRRLTRTLWFQSIELSETDITFQFTSGILTVIAAIPPAAVEERILKGIQYKGKHTLKVFDIIWPGRDSGVSERSIPELMRLLSLEHTRYSYGQLKLRVLEPSLREIYEWDEAVFVRFGPVVSGRRAEGIWFEVTTGEAAKALRQAEPEIRFAAERPLPPG